MQRLGSAKRPFQDAPTGGGKRHRFANWLHSPGAGVLAAPARTGGAATVTKIISDSVRARLPSSSIIATTISLNGSKTAVPPATHTSSAALAAPSPVFLTRTFDSLLSVPQLEHSNNSGPSRDVAPHSILNRTPWTPLASRTAGVEHILPRTSCRTYYSFPPIPPRHARKGHAGFWSCRLT